MSRVLRFAVFGLLFILPPAMAAGSQPTKASVETLMKVMHTQDMIDTFIPQTQMMLEASAHRVLQEKEFTPHQKKIFDDMSGKIAKLLKTKITWQLLKPEYIAIYQKTFTQKEIDGMTAFYKTPVGQADLAKMPGTQQKMMEAVQAQIGELLPKIRELQRDSLEQMKAAGPISPALNGGSQSN